MAGYISEEYSAVNVWLCPSDYVPSGICYPEKCVSTYVTATVRNAAPLLNTVINGFPAEIYIGTEIISVTAYLLKDDDGDYVINAFILPSDKTEYEFQPPCADYTDGSTYSKWERIGGRIRGYFPQIRTCGVTSLIIRSQEGDFSITEINPVGEITSALTEYTHNEDGYVPLYTQLSSKMPVPGKTLSAFFKIYDIPEEHYLGSYMFQTDIFTGALLLGCAVVAKVKRYKDKERPEKGYTYETVPIKGGIGSRLSDEWLTDNNLRWCVEYFGKRYWLKSVYPCRLPAGSHVTVAKSFSLPRFPDADINSSFAKKTLSESEDIIVSEAFYRQG